MVEGTSVRIGPYESVEDTGPPPEVSALSVDESDDISELDDEIERVYLWWHENAPGVTPREHGYLGRLWSEWDRRVGD